MPTVKYLKEMAKDLKVKNYAKKNKEELIWAIQEAEGHDSCFHRIHDCGIDGCLFRPDCITTA